MKSRFRSFEEIAGLMAVTTMLVAGTFSVARKADADDNPATAPLALACAVDPASSTGFQSGARAIAPGESADLVSTLEVEEGTVYQDILRRPDGSIYYATFLRARALASPLAVDAASATLTISGVPQALTPGTGPLASSFVLHTETDGSGTSYTVYFPGDEAAMLAAQPGTGVPSYEVGAGGATFELRLTGEMSDQPAVTSGASFLVADCAASVSTGPSNRATSTSGASLAIAEPNLQIEKSVTPATVSAGGTATYTLLLSNPEPETGRFAGTAHDITVIDTPSAGLVALNSEGEIAEIGDEVGAGGVWDGSRIVFSISSLAPGATLPLTYRMLVDPTLPASTPITNSATATTSSVPGDADEERTYTAGPATASSTTGLITPAIVKSVSPAEVPIGIGASYTVNVTIPANGSPLHNVTIIDELPDGMTYGGTSPLAVTCTSGCPVGESTGSALLPIAVTPSGESRAGWYLGTLAPNATSRTYRITYQASIKPSRADGTPVALNDRFVNTARVGFNAIDRLGAVRPSLGRPPAFDAQAASQATVEFDRPIVSISKASQITGTDVDPVPGGTNLYTITVRNTGGVDAVNVDISDYGTLLLNTAIPGLPTGVTSPSTYQFRVALVPAGGSVTFSYQGRYPNYSFSSRVQNNAWLGTYRSPAGASFTGNSADGPNYATTSFDLGRPNLTVTKRPVVTPVAVAGPVEWEVVLTNIGTATAYQTSLTDTLPSGWTIATPVTGATWPGSGSILTVSTPIPPGQSHTVRFRTNVPSGTAAADVTNSVRATWRDGAGRAGTWVSGTWTDFLSTGSGVVSLVTPLLTIQKKPDVADIPTPVIQQNGTGNFTITVQNPTTVAITNLVVTDTLPAELAFNSGSAVWTVNPEPAVAPTVNLSTAGAGPAWTVSRLEPGAVFQVTFSVTQNGSAPASGTMVNSAQATGDGVAVAVSDTATALFAPDIAEPVVTKAADPAFGAPGQRVRYTIRTTIPNNVLPLYDVAVTDVLPDGVSFDAPVSATCTSGTCPAGSPVLYAPQTGPGVGETTTAVFLGDIPAGSGPIEYTIVFDAVVNATFADGVQVIDQVREPLLNVAGAHYSTDPSLDQSTPSTGATWSDVPFQYRTASAVAAFDVRTPSLALTKVIVDHTPFDWTDAVTGNTKSIYALNPAERITYEIVVTNRGSAPAYDVILADDLAQGDLSGVTYALPTGVTTQPMGDGSVRFLFADPIAPGGSVTLRYSATVPDSANLRPDLSGDSRDVDEVANQLTAVEYHSLGAGLPGNLVFSEANNPLVTAYIYTPTLETVAHACYTVQPADSVEVSLDWSNRIRRSNGKPPTPIIPIDETVGTANDPVLTVTVPAGLRYVPGTARATGEQSASPTSAAPTGFRNPDTTSIAPDGSQVLVWNFPDTPYTPADKVDLYLYFRVTNTTTGPLTTPIRSVITATDNSGSSSRGSTSGAFHEYRNVWVAGCQIFELYKTPDRGDYFPGEEVTWNFTTANDPTQPFTLTNGTFTDTLPVGLLINDGSLRLTVTAMDGTSITYAPGDSGFPTQNVTILADGRQRITWTGGALVGPFRDASGSFVSTIQPTAPVNTTVTNYVDFRNDVEMFDACVDPNTECDTGTISILDPNVPQISKSVDRSADVYGSSPNWTLTVRIPANTAYSQLKVVDVPAAAPFRALVDSTFVTVSASCVSGCTPTSDIPVTSMARTTHTYGVAPTAVTTTASASWYLGDIAPSSEDRVVQIVYSARTLNMTELAVTPAGAPNGTNTSRVITNSASLRVNSGTCAAPGCVQSVGSGSLVADDSASFTLNYPWVTHTKVCRSLTGNQDPAPALAGANLRCTIEVVNESSAPAYGVEVRDYPRATSTSTPTYNITWNVVATSGDAIPSTSWSAGASDANGRYLAWTLPSIGAGETKRLVVDFNVDGWTGNPTATTTTGTSENVARLQPWKLTATSAQTIGAVTPRSAAVVFRPTRLEVAKRRVHSSTEDQALLDAWRAEPASFDYSLPSAASRYQEHLPGDKIQWAVHAWMVNKSDMSTIAIRDTLPGGVRYRAGSARLVWVDRDPTSGAVIGSGFTPIGDPGIVSVASPVCPAFGDLAIAGNGDQLTWSFTKDVAGWTGSPWRSEGTADLVVSGQAFDRDGHMILVFDVDHTSAVNDCINPTLTAGHGILVNQVSASGTTASARPIPAANAEFRYAYHNPLELVKRPDGGTVAAGDTGVFNIDVTWWMWGSNSTSSWRPDLTVADDPHVTGPVTFTDTFVDDGLYQPGSATATMIGPDGNVYPVILNEVSAVAGVDATSGRANRTITWQVPSLPPSATDYSAPYERSNPYRRKPVSLSISVPVNVPVGTIDGTKYLNDVSVVVPPAVDPTSPNFLDKDPLVATDVADITAVNPSPPPPASKSASPTTAAPGGLVDWSVNITLPARQVFYDLAYTDLLPAGLTYLSYIGATCVDSLGADCAADLPVSMVSLPATGTAGPATYGWSFGDVMGAMQDRTVTLRFRTRVETDEAPGSTLTNTVTGFSNRTDAGDSIPTTPATTGDMTSGPRTGSVLLGRPTLGIAKTTTTPGPLSEGAPVSYAVTVTNTGLTTAYDFEVTDTPSDAVENLVLTGPTASLALNGWSRAEPEIVWYVSSLAAGASLTFTYSGNVRVGYGTDGTTRADNVAVAGTYRSQPIATPHATYPPVSDDLSILLNGPRLTVEKFASASCTNVAATFVKGQPFTWCVRIRNSGNALMRSVDLTDFLPSGWSYEAGSATIDGLAIEPSQSTTAWGVSQLLWPAGDIAAGQTVELLYRTIPGESASSLARNTFTAVGRLADGSPAPPAAADYRVAGTAAAINALAGIEIAKTPDIQSFGCLPVGCEVTWTITVSNPGTATVTNPVVSDTLPAGLTWVSSSLNGAPVGWVEDGTTAGPGGTAVRSWSAASLAPGASFTITVVAAIPGGSTADSSYINHVEFTADEVPVPVANQARVRAYAPASLGDTVWHDLDGDGVQDVGEPGLAGVTVQLLDADGNVVASTPTDGSGAYLFEGLVPDTYQVRFVTPSGFIGAPADRGGDNTTDSDADTTTGLTASIVLASGENNATVDAGFLQLGSLGDRVWRDLNGDGRADADEPGIGSVVVTLTGVTGSGAEISRSMSTDSEGRYLFTDLPPGTYTVTFAAPAGLGFTTQDQGSEEGLDSDAGPTGSTAPIALQSGQARTDVDAGLIPLPSITLADYVYVDSNCNRQRDAGELGLAGIRVDLELPDGSTRSTVTGPDGQYVFTDLPPGRYTVRVVVAPPYIVTATCGNDPTNPVDILQTGVQGSIPIGVSRASLPVTGSSPIGLLAYAVLSLMLGLSLVALNKARTRR